MRKRVLFPLVIVSVILCSWIKPERKVLNYNSWTVSVGKEVLLASWKGNVMGDTAMIDLDKIKPGDTLFVKRFLCGFSSQQAVTTLNLRNDQNDSMKEIVNRNSLSIATSLWELKTSGKINSGEFLSIYLAIDSKPEKFKEAVLLGKLMLK